MPSWSSASLQFLQVRFLWVDFLFESSFVRPFNFDLLISALIVPRATFRRTSGLNTLSAHDSSPVVPYTEIVSIWLLNAPRTGQFIRISGRGREPFEY